MRRQREQIEYEVVWRPAWNAQSLLKDYPRQSCLADLCQHAPNVKRKGIRKPSKAYGWQVQTFAKAKADADRYR